MKSQKTCWRFFKRPRISDSRRFEARASSKLRQIHAKALEAASSIATATTETRSDGIVLGVYAWDRRKRLAGRNGPAPLPFRKRPDPAPSPAPAIMRNQEAAHVASAIVQANSSGRFAWCHPPECAFQLPANPTSWHRTLDDMCPAMGSSGHLKRELK